MGLLIFFLLFITVQADVVALPSNLTNSASNFRINGSPLNGTRVDPLTDQLSNKTDTELKVGGSFPLFMPIADRSSPLISPALPRKSFLGILSL